MGLLASSDQNPVLTLLSSTSQPAPSPLWTQHRDPRHPQQSCIEVLLDTEASSSRIPRTADKGCLAHNVVHLSSPALSRTYIQAGAFEATHRDNHGQGETLRAPLGISLSWVGMHLRPLGRRPFTIELGIVDTRGVPGVIRVSSFKHEPSIHTHRDVPLVHLPLTLPRRSPSTLTRWLHISVNLQTLIPLFNTLSLRQTAMDGSGTRHGKKRKVAAARVPTGRLGSVSYVRVYANCRVRRVWFAEDGERSLERLGRAGEEEWGLYAAEAVG